MALPTSGQLTLAQIRDEFGAGTTSNVSLRTLSAAAGLSAPDGFNEFYGLQNRPNFYTNVSVSNATRRFPSNGSYTITGSGTQASPWQMATTSYTSAKYDDGDNEYFLGYNFDVNLIDTSFSYETRVHMRVASWSPGWTANFGYLFHDYSDYPYVKTFFGTVPNTSWYADPQTFTFSAAQPTNTYKWYMYNVGSYTTSFIIQAWIEVVD